MNILKAPRFQSRASVWVSALAVGAAAALSACSPDLADDGVEGSGIAALGTTTVLTRNYNNQRTGANLQESALTTASVNPSRFGKLFQVSVDDQVYAGVLYASAVPIGGTTRNVIYVATVSNSIYAFDADAGGGALWRRDDLNGSGRPGRNTDVGGACGTYQDFSGNIGIIGTPVIDAGSMTLYAVTRTVENGGAVFRLRALDMTSGQDRAHSPQVLAGSVAGAGAGSNGGRIAFDPQPHNQRPALALSGGVVYIAFASFCDTAPYHGWVMAYDAQSLGQVGIINLTPAGQQAGIWMAGAAPMFDGNGNLYLSTGNGDFNQGAGNFGESLVKLAPRSLGVLDSFTPSNFADLNAGDVDFGSAGPIMLPGTNLLATGGKEGKVYLLNSGNLGRLGDQNAVQVFQAVDLGARPNNTHHIHNSAITWQSPQGLNLYVWGENDFLRLYRFDGSRFTVPAARVGSVLPPVGMPGGMMTLSANGSAAGTGILWATTPRSGDANHNVVPGLLSAFNAETLDLLWQSTAGGDDPLNFAKGSPPTVASGKVYVASLSNAVSAYGLRSAGGGNPNLALGKSATGSPSCASTETPDKAVNGSTSGGNSDKWCSFSPPLFLQVDLGSAQTVNQFVVRHAGSGGEDLGFDTRDFSLQVSTDGNAFNTVVNVTGSNADVTTHSIAAASARFVRLNVATPTQNGDQAARIYELEVYGGGSGGSGGGSGGGGGSTAPVTFETETLAVSATSGDLERLAPDPGLSGGQGTILEANAAGDFAAYTVNVPQAGNYDLRVRHKQWNNRGIWQLSVDGANRGPTVDGFSNNIVYTEADLGPVTLTSAGNHTFQFTMTGKNAASTAFWLALDYIRLIPQ